MVVKTGLPGLIYRNGRLNGQAVDQGKGLAPEVRPASENKVENVWNFFWHILFCYPCRLFGEGWQGAKCFYGNCVTMVKKTHHRLQDNL